MKSTYAIFYGSISITFTMLGRINRWGGTHQSHERSKRRRRARSSPSHKSAACIIGIDEPPNFGAAGSCDNSTRIDRRWIASKGLLCLITNQASAGDSTNRDFEVEIGFGAINMSCLHA